MCFYSAAFCRIYTRQHCANIAVPLFFVLFLLPLYHFNGIVNLSCTYIVNFIYTFLFKSFAWYFHITWIRIHSNVCLYPRNESHWPDCSSILYQPNWSCTLSLFMQLSKYNHCHIQFCTMLILYVIFSSFHPVTH